MAQCDRALGQPQSRLAGGIDPVQKLRPGERRIDIRHGIVEADFVLLDELHRGDRGDRLCHRGDAEQGAERHHAAGVEIAHPKGAIVDDTAITHCDCDNAGHFARLNGVAQHVVDPLLHCDRHLDPANVSKAVVPAKVGPICRPSQA